MEHDRLEEQVQSLSMQTKVEEPSTSVHECPRIRYALSLYGNISSIKWDYEDDNVIQGVVSRADGGQVQRFCLDPAKHSPYFVTNYLWDLIG